MMKIIDESKSRLAILVAKQISRQDVCEPCMPRIGAYGARHQYPLDYAMRKRMVVRDIELGLLSRDEITYFLSDGTLTVNDVRDAKAKQHEMVELLGY